MTGTRFLCTAFRGRAQGLCARISRSICLAACLPGAAPALAASAAPAAGPAPDTSSGLLLPVLAGVCVLVVSQVVLGVSNLRRRRAERQLAAMHENTMVGILLFTGDRIISKANRRAGEIFGWEPEELVGQSSRLIHLDEEHYRRFGREHLSTLATSQVMHVDWPFRAKDGHTVWCRISGSALYPPDLSRGVVWVHDDITGQRENLARLRESESVNAVRLDIANAMLNTESLDGFFQHVHRTLQGAMHAPTFFVALVDGEHERLAYPYYSDGTERVRGSESLSGPDQGSPALQVIRSGGHGAVRAETGAWVGVPLMVRGRVAGAMVARDEDGAHAYGRAEARLMETAADQVGIALERRRADDDLKRSEAKFRTLFMNMRDGVVRHDLSGRILECNRAFRRLLQYSEEELTCMYWQDITPPEWHEQETRVLDEQVLEDGYSEVYEKEYVTGDGRFVPVELRTHLARDGAGRPLDMWSTVRDVTDRKRMETELRRQALHDPLTGLANRTLCLDRLRQCMGRARRRSGGFYAVIFLDLDRFKVVNDSLGHSYGDRLLVEVADRLKECVRELDTVARYGGDEFVVVLEELESPRQAIRVVKRMRGAMRRTFILGEKDVHLTTSIGIVLGPVVRGSAEEILQNSNIALHRAKDKGRDRFKVFTDRMLEHAVHQLALENDLADGLASGQFSVHFQPIVNLQSGCGLYGFEALARWNHPERGAIAPDEFIPVAEESGSIHDLGMWVLHEACSIMARWRESHPEAEHLMLAVNISGRQFSQMDLVPRVRRILEKTGMPPERLKLEITETAIMDNPRHAADRLRRLKELGIALSIDDFGTGYSSMSSLQSLPVDNLKIDLSFVRRMDQAPEDVEIVRAIISLAHSLGMCVVAEGVEQVRHQDILSQLGCEYGQGFLYSRPVPEAEALALLDLGRTLAQHLPPCDVAGEQQ